MMGRLGTTHYISRVRGIDTFFPIIMNKVSEQHSYVALFVYI